jgi:hypothetical protein
LRYIEISWDTWDKISKNISSNIPTWGYYLGDFGYLIPSWDILSQYLIKKYFM